MKREKRNEEWMISANTKTSHIFFSDHKNYQSTIVEEQFSSCDEWRINKSVAYERSRTKNIKSFIRQKNNETVPEKCGDWYF